MYWRSGEKPGLGMLLLTVVQLRPLLVVRPSVRLHGLQPLRLEPMAQSWLVDVGSQALVTSPLPEGQAGFWLDQDVPPLVVRSTVKLPLTRANRGSEGCIEAAGSVVSLGQEVHCSAPQLIAAFGANCPGRVGKALPMGGMGWGWTSPADTSADIDVAL